MAIKNNFLEKELLIDKSKRLLYGGRANWLGVGNSVRLTIHSPLLQVIYGRAINPLKIKIAMQLTEAELTNG